ncbi:hypothetical protein [Photobacterium kishitanii]|uniref:hypothetical protein n=1 Tax=Photobacterium kishitanii TaxID=318456 RepID=UPI0007F8B22A|nr:hypothetical protein [Photobacterium kishitanii]OBU24041.1 hypothetical protein AYY23_11515 [Photobacterium kishitanii]
MYLEKFKIQDLSFIYLSCIYIYLPFISVITRPLGIPIIKPLVDLTTFFFLLLVILSVIINGRFLKIKTWLFPVALFLLIMGVLKFIYVYNSGMLFYWFPIFAEIKPVIYILIGIFLCYNANKVKPEDFVRFGHYLSIFIIISVITNFILGWGLRPVVLSESNYDGFLILISLCYALTLNKNTFFFC